MLAPIVFGTISTSLITFPFVSYAFMGILSISYVIASENLLLLKSINALTVAILANVSSDPLTTTWD